MHCLQGVHWDSNMIASISTDGGGNNFVGTNNSKSVAILFNHNFNAEVPRKHWNSDGSCCHSHVSLWDALVVLYCPNADTSAFFGEVRNLIEDSITPHCIVVGDWNAVPNTYMDSSIFLLQRTQSLDKLVLIDFFTQLQNVLLSAKIGQTWFFVVLSGIGQNHYSYKYNRVQERSFHDKFFFQVRSDCNWQRVLKI